MKIIEIDKILQNQFILMREFYLLGIILETFRNNVTKFYIYIYIHKVSSYRRPLKYLRAFNNINVQVHMSS